MSRWSPTVTPWGGPDNVGRGIADALLAIDERKRAEERERKLDERYERGEKRQAERDASGDSMRRLELALRGISQGGRPEPISGGSMQPQRGNSTQMGGGETLDPMRGNRTQAGTAAPPTPAYLLPGAYNPTMQGWNPPGMQEEEEERYRDLGDGYTLDREVGDPEYRKRQIRQEEVDALIASLEGTEFEPYGRLLATNPQAIDDIARMLNPDEAAPRNIDPLSPEGIQGRKSLIDYEERVKGPGRGRDDAQGQLAALSGMIDDTRAERDAIDIPEAWTPGMGTDSASVTNERTTVLGKVSDFDRRLSDLTRQRRDVYDRRYNAGETAPRDGGSFFGGGRAPGAERPTPPSGATAPAPAGGKPDIRQRAKQLNQEYRGDRKRIAAQLRAEGYQFRE